MKKSQIPITIKPWGKEELLENNEFYVLKRLTMKKGKRCSLQYHKLKIETVYLLRGLLNIYIGSNKDNLTTKILKPNEFITIKPGTIHRMEGLKHSVYTESSTPQLSDVVRIEDDYNRTS